MASTITTKVDGATVLPDLQVAVLYDENGNVMATAQAATVAAVAGLTPAGGTGATAGAYDSAANRDVFIATVAEMKARLNELIANLKTAGYLAT